MKRQQPSEDEVRSAKAYRARYSEGPLWGELSDTLKRQWVEHVRKLRKQQTKKEG